MSVQTFADVRHLLANQRGSLVHVIDPYKVSVEQAVEKALAMKCLPSDLLIVGSTDYDDFFDYMPPYLEKLHNAASPSILLHFPPRKGQGFPFCKGADGIIGSCVLKTEDPYFGSECLLETRYFLSTSTLEKRPVLFTSAAFTFGPDNKTYGAVRSLSCFSLSDLDPYLNALAEFDIVYLYARHSMVDPEICRTIRSYLSSNQLLFVSGGIQTRKQADEFFSEGADFVVFGSALETPNWRSTLKNLI